MIPQPKLFASNPPAVFVNSQCWKGLVLTLNAENTYSAETAQSMPEPAKQLQDQPQDALLAYESASLLKGQHEILIHHNGEVYRLRLTKNNKLILHK